MSLETEIGKMQQLVPECVAVGVVDMSSGMLLGVRTVDSHPQEVLDLVAAATSDLFQGATVSEIEQMFRRARGVPEDGHRYFQEVIMLSDNLLHLFMRCKKNQSTIIVAVCRVSANLGMALTRSRRSISEIEKWI